MNQQIDPRNLVWDGWNIEHIARHNVTREEVEEVCLGRCIVREGYRQRIMLVGPTELGRMLAVVLEPRANGRFYPMTAYTASRRMRRTYAEESGGSAP